MGCDAYLYIQKDAPIELTLICYTCGKLVNLKDPKEGHGSDCFDRFLPDAPEFLRVNIVINNLSMR